MATAGGPNIERDGLVFGYDTSYGIDTNNISSRFYPGEPTTNLVTSPFEINNTTSTDIPPELVGEDITGYASYSSGYSVFSSQTSSTSSTGKTFQYSIWMRSPGGVSTYLLYVYDGTGPDGGWWSFGEGALTDEWQRITGSRSNMTGTVTTIRVYRRNQQGTIEMVAPQLEVNSHVTPFTEGSRSSTQSLIDLTKTTDIDVSNVSFDSTGQPTFDGTDDYISLNTPPSLTGAFTVTCWFKKETNSERSFLGKTTGGSGTKLIFLSNNNIFFRMTEGGSSSNFSIGYTTSLNNEWNFLTATRSSSGVVSASINGNSLTTGGTLTGTFSPTAIGRNGDGQYWDGALQNIKIYNRVLSSDEIQQNYNAYKNRFNI